MAMRTTRARVVTTGLLLTGLLAACSGGGDADGGVASLDDDAISPTTTGSEASGEEQLLEYVECLRNEGLDVPDPQVDQNGNLVLPFGPGQEATIDPSDLERVSDVCGDMPLDAVAGSEHPDLTQFEDMLLEFAECMRGEGIDLPDPDLSADPSRGGSGPFGDDFDIGNLDDPEEAAAYETCRPILADAGFGG